MPTTQTLLTSTDTDYIPAGTVLLTCATLASAAKMASVGHACIWCSKVLVAKLGGGFIAGTMLGDRASATDGWTWAGPFCAGCEKDHGKRLN